MRNLYCLCLLAIATAVNAQTSLNRFDELSTARMKLTSEFAKIQDQLRSKDDKVRSAGESGLSQLGPKVELMRDELISANQRIIEALNVNFKPPANSNDYIFGAYDPSATIVTTLGKLLRENKELARISLPRTAPFSPQDLNTYQQVLDRLKRGIDEHRHSAINQATTLTQRQRKRAEPAKVPANLPI